jgi:hypothetical protein
MDFHSRGVDTSEGRGEEHRIELKKRVKEISKGKSATTSYHFYTTHP